MKDQSNELKQNLTLDIINDDSYCIFKSLNYPHIKPLFHEESIKNTTTTISSSSSSSTSPPTHLTTAAAFLSSLIVPSSSEKNSRIHDYTLGPVIGYGGFSVVHTACHYLMPHQIKAVKVVTMACMSETDIVRFNRELTIWKSLCHPRVVNLLKVFKKRQNYYLICDYCPGGTLLQFLNKHKLLEQDAKRIFKELCQAVHYLHIDRKVCHKDLKLENVLIDENGHIKLCDFGLALYLTHKSYSTRFKQQETAGGSLAYTAPEQLIASVSLACPKTDIWSLGVILYALVVGQLPFMDTFDLRLVQKIQQGAFEMPDDLSEPLQYLIRACLNKGPDKRPSIDQILKSPWLM